MFAPRVVNARMVHKSGELLESPEKSVDRYQKSCPCRHAVLASALADSPLPLGVG